MKHLPDCIAVDKDMGDFELTEVEFAEYYYEIYMHSGIDNGRVFTVEQSAKINCFIVKSRETSLHKRDL